MAVNHVIFDYAVVPPMATTLFLATPGGKSDPSRIMTVYRRATWLTSALSHFIHRIF
jgi:hypothetical protein